MKFLPKPDVVCIGENKTLTPNLLSLNPCRSSLGDAIGLVL